MSQVSNNPSVRQSIQIAQQSDNPAIKSVADGANSMLSPLFKFADAINSVNDFVDEKVKNIKEFIGIEDSQEGNKLDIDS